MSNIGLISELTYSPFIYTFRCCFRSPIPRHTSHGQFRSTYAIDATSAPLSVLGQLRDYRPGVVATNIWRLYTEVSMAVEPRFVAAGFPRRFSVCLLFSSFSFSCPNVSCLCTKERPHVICQSFKAVGRFSPYSLAQMDRVILQCSRI